MSATQLHLIALPPRLRPRLRSVRRPFHAPEGAAPYRLPHTVRDDLQAALACYRNRESAFTLAILLARFWSAPKRLLMAFPVDRRALAGRADLDLTEARIRGGIKALLEVGFLERQEREGPKLQRTAAGGLQRRPILYRIGRAFLPAFAEANRRAQKARERQGRERRPLPTPALPKPSTPAPGVPAYKVAHKENGSVPSVLMGQAPRRTPAPPAPNPGLEAALERWSRALRGEC